MKQIRSFKNKKFENVSDYIKDILTQNRDQIDLIAKTMGNLS